MKTIKLFTSLLVATVILGCGNNSKSDTDTQTTSTQQVDRSFKEVFVSTSFYPEESEKSTFVLFPSLRDVLVQVADFSLPVKNINDSQITLFLSQISDPQNSTDLIYDETKKGFTAGSVPISFKTKTELYPRFKIVIEDKGDNKTITKETILYQSETKNCQACHASNSFANARPINGWVNISDIEVDYKTNILRLHDERFGSKTTNLIGKKLSSYGYDTKGLEASASRIVVKCTDCHHVMAVSGSGEKNIPPLTSALHKTHMNLSDPYMENISSCITCHPSDNIPMSSSDTVMHQRGRTWFRQHKDIPASKTKNCTLCHGFSYNGSDLSKIAENSQFGKKTYLKGDIVGCTDCHSNTTTWDIKKNIGTMGAKNSNGNRRR